MENIARSEYVDDIDFKSIFKTLWRGKYWILMIVMIVGVISAVVVLNLPNIYRSETVLSPVSEAKSGALAGIAGQLGGLASLAGVSIGGGSGIDKATLAIETLKARIFLTDFIKRHEMTIPIMAAKAWDSVEKRWVIDPAIYDVNEKKWVRKVNAPMTPEPSELEVYRVFNQMVSISQDKKSQIVVLSVDSLSPIYAQKWANALVADINAYIRQKDVEQAERSIEYLSKEIEMTSITHMQAVLYQLIEEQKKTVMLASVRDGYVFQVIDPAVIPEEKNRPKRAVIVLVSVIAALLAGAVGVLFIYGSKKSSKSLREV